jgi:hypothetical protein
VNAQKVLRVERFFETAHRFPKQMRLASDVQFGVISGRFDPINFIGFDEVYAPGRFKSSRSRYLFSLFKSFSKAVIRSSTTVRMGYFYMLARAVESRAQAVFAERFQEVIERVKFKGFEGVMVESRDENNDRQVRRIERLQNFKAVICGI